MAESNPKTAHFSPSVRRLWPVPRLWAIALVTFRQGMRMRLWVLVPLAIAILVLADLSSPRFSPVFDAIPAAVSTSLLAMAVLSVVVGVFLATFSIPAEVEAKVAYSVVTKPVGRAEIVVGKTLGMSLLLLVMLALVGVGAYVYILIRAQGSQALAARLLEEQRPRAVHPADLNALEAVARGGPLMTHRYQLPQAGPEPLIHFGPDAPPPGFRWIIGESGLRLLWDMAQTPLRQWAASGPCRLHLTLQALRTAGPAQQPVQISVALVNPRVKQTIESALVERPTMPVRYVLADIPASGEVEVSVAAPDAPPAKGVLNLPPEGELLLEVMVGKAAHLVGAKADSVRIIGPAGQQHTVCDEPAVRAGLEFGRMMLVGRPELPRQVAVFRFSDVPPGDLGPAETSVEIGFSLDAWGAAMIQPAAEATFVKPGTGEQKTFRFTPEGHRSTVLYLDRSFWHGGPLEVRLECLTADDFMGLVPESVRLRLDGGPFALHFAKAAFDVWLFGTVLAAVGVALSTRLTWYVSILCTAAFLILSMFRDFVVRSTVLGRLASVLAKAANAAVAWSGWPGFCQHLVVPIPDLRGMMPDESVSMGRVLPTAEIAASFGWAVLGVAVLMLAGALMLRKREVAA